MTLFCLLLGLILYLIHLKRSNNRKESLIRYAAMRWSHRGDFDVEAADDGEEKHKESESQPGKRT